MDEVLLLEINGVKVPDGVKSIRISFKQFNFTFADGKLTVERCDTRPDKDGQIVEEVEWDASDIKAVMGAPRYTE